LYYAQLDEKGKVYTVCELAKEELNQNLVAIDAFDESLLNKYYDAETGIFEEITLSADKTTIQADGQDKATITAKMPKVFFEAVFKNGMTGEVIAVLPVNSETRLAALEIRATTPGEIVVAVEEKLIKVVAQ